MKMKKLLFVILSLFICASSVSAQTSNDKILGKWVNEERTIVIEFVKNDSAYDAIIRKAEDSTLIGKKLITGLVVSDGSSFSKGVIHFIKRGKTANCKAKIIENEKLEIKASKGITSKSQIWKRYK